MSDTDEQSPIAEGSCAKCGRDDRKLPETNERGEAICFTCWSMTTLGRCASCHSFKLRPFKDQEGKGVYCSKNCQEQGEQTEGADTSATAVSPGEISGQGLAAKKLTGKPKGHAPNTVKITGARRPRRSDMGSLRARELGATKAPRQKKPPKPKVPREKKPATTNPARMKHDCPKCGRLRRLTTKDAVSPPQCERCNEERERCPGCGEDAILRAKDAQSEAMCRICNNTSECPLCHKAKYLCRTSETDGANICAACALMQKERAECPLCHKPKLLNRRSTIDDAAICARCAEKQTKMGFCPGCKNPKLLTLSARIQTEEGIVNGCQVCYRNQKKMGTVPVE